MYARTCTIVRCSEEWAWKVRLRPNKGFKRTRSGLRRYSEAKRNRRRRLVVAELF